MRKTLYINGKFLNQNLTGVQRFASNLVLNLDKLYSDEKPDFDVVLVTPFGASVLELKFIKQIYIGPRMNNNAWEQLYLGAYVFGRPLLNLSGSSPILNMACNFITIHDAAIYLFPDSYKSIFRYWYKFLYTCHSLFSRNIFTVSNHSADELRKIFPKKKFTVLYNAADHFGLENESSEEVLGKFNLSIGSYFLVVASFNPTKNLRNLILAYELYKKNGEIKLVVVGSPNSAIFADSLSTFEKRDVIFTDKVNDSELSALYRNALAFIFPSIHEGFGIPPLEAMICGCPVLASKRSSIPEVCGDAAVYFNPYDPQDIAEKMLHVSTNFKMRDELISMGADQVKKFSWLRSAAVLKDSIKELIN